MAAECKAVFISSVIFTCALLLVTPAVRSGAVYLFLVVAAT